MHRAAALLTVLAGCVGSTAELAPISDENRVRGRHWAATQSAEGVRLLILGDAWEGDPATLESTVTPAYVEVENHSGRPLRIRYPELALRDLAGRWYLALPPLQVNSAPTTRYLAPGLSWSGFIVAPMYDPYYRGGVAPWEGPFDYDPLYYDRYFPYWGPQLPTDDMLNAALPEGVLLDGGKVSGFVYFQRVPANLERVQLQFDLVNAEDGQRFGQLVFPLKVEDEPAWSMAAPASVRG